MTGGSTSFKTSQEMWYDCLYKAADWLYCILGISQVGWEVIFWYSYM